MSNHVIPKANTITKKQLHHQLEHIVDQVGGDSSSLSGEIVAQIMQTTARLISDKADDGELKLIARSLKELRHALNIFRKYKEYSKISIFGSARTVENNPAYTAAATFSKEMAQAGWMTITGAGDGIMRAGNQGAGANASFGLAIRLPFETTENEYIADDSKLIIFRYFFTRKLNFIWHSNAVALFPGGFGTMDEGFEALTLVQTGKAPMMPIVMVDEPGGQYWQAWDNYVHNHLLEREMISEQDLNLYKITDNPKQAAEHVCQFYSNYHSQRYVGDWMVLRIKKPLDNKYIEELNSEFKDLVAQGRIQQGGPLDQEIEYLDLPRIYFNHTKRGYGRLRVMIDRINEMA